MATIKSQNFLAAIHARETSQVFLDLLTVTSPDLEESPIYLTNNRTPVTSRGNTYTPLPFTVPAPGERENSLPAVELQMAAIYDPDAPMEGGVVGMIERINTGAARLEFVLASAPDSVEYGPFDFEIKKSRYDARNLTVSLGFEDLLNAQFPGHAFTPGNTPGVFRG